MNTNRFFKFCSLSFLMSMLFISCNPDVIEEVEKEPDNKTLHTCELFLNVTKTDFPESPQGRSSTSWEDGDKIHLTFTTESGSTYGEAVYGDSKWSVSYYGELTKGASTKCNAVYFENFKSDAGSVVYLTDSTGIYEDLNAIYVYDGESLSVSANLTPKTGRIRFEGNDNDTITIHGITCYTGYDASLCKYTSTDVAIKTVVKSGYTPYIYGVFSDTIQPRLNFITQTSGYTKIFPTTIFKQGESGFITIPSETSYSGWENAVIFKINGVEFKMIPVEYDSGNFILAETETTTALYNAVMETGTTGTNLPIMGLGQSSYYGFISKLKLITSLNFYIPSYDELKWAAKGGKKSLGFTYSGSNNIDEVAWYKGNSDGKSHEVKQLQPNELGLYDMSGNVAEFYSYSYSSGYYYYSSFGGHYGDEDGNCTNTSCLNNSSYYHNDALIGKIGLRFALKP